MVGQRQCDIKSKWRCFTMISTQSINEQSTNVQCSNSIICVTRRIDIDAISSISTWNIDNVLWNVSTWKFLIHWIRIYYPCDIFTPSLDGIFKDIHISLMIWKKKLIWYHYISYHLNIYYIVFRRTKLRKLPPPENRALTVSC